MEYMGHKNWDYWNVCLWLFNDEFYYKLMVDEYWRNSRFCKRNQIKKTAEYMYDILEPFVKTPDGADWTFDSIKAAVSTIED